MSSAKMLVWSFLTHSIWIKWVRKIPTSVIAHCLSLPSWLEWMNFLKIAWNWSLSPMNFSINLPNIFRRTIGWNILKESYEALLGLEMMIVNNILKYNGQCSKLIYTLAILIMFFKHLSFLTTTLRCFYNTLSNSGKDELLYLAIALLNSLFEKSVHSILDFVEIFSRACVLTC